MPELKKAGAGTLPIFCRIRIAGIPRGESRMNLRVTATAALVVCLGVSFAHSVLAQRQHEYQTANPFRTQNPFRNARQYEYQTAGQRQLKKQYRPARQHLPVVEHATTQQYVPEKKQAESVASYNTFETIESNQYDTFEASQCDNCSTGDCCGDCLCCDSGCFDEGCSSFPTGNSGREEIFGDGFLSRPGQFFIGLDYLNVRSTFSESTAFVTSTGGTPLPGSPLLFPPVVNTFNELDYNYESSYRVYGGYRLCDCDAEIRFAFTRFTSSANADSGAVPAPSNGQSTQFLSPIGGDLVVTNVGDRLVVNSDVTADLYDLDFAKTIPLGQSDCGCSDPCDSFDPCCDSGCGWCPAWDLKWSAGLRFADINWNNRTVRRSLTPALDGENASMTMNFQGGGIRAGLEGTRYLGRQRISALFVRSNVSLLLGDVEIEHFDDFADITTRFSSTQLIPVLDLEAGGRVNLTENVLVSAGYLFSAWHDLGMRGTFDVLNGRGPTFDDANILGFDGFFARAEISY